MKSLLSLEIARTAIVTVDMQRDYLDETVGSNLLPRLESRRVLTQTVHLLELGRSCGMSIVHAYVRRRPIEIKHEFVGTPLSRIGRAHNLSQSARGMIRRIPDRLEGSPQAEIAPALVAPEDVHVTTKKTMDAFYDTELELVLGRVLQVQTVIIAGINTDTCVHNTAFAAANHGYQPIVVSDCTASTRGTDHHWMALELMSRTFAWVLSLTELEVKLTAPAAIAASMEDHRGPQTERS